MTSPEPSVTDENPTAAEESGAESGAANVVPSALARYRVMAYIVGVGLLALCGSMLLKYVFDSDGSMAIIGPAHGFLYVVYLVATVDLAIKAGWSMKGTVLVMLAGMVPFVSFVAERQVVRKVGAGTAL